MRMRSEHEPIEILLVEDNPGDVGLVLEGFKESLIAHRISVIDDGEEALTYLRTEQHPCQDGQEELRRLQSQMHERGELLQQELPLS